MWCRFKGLRAGTKLLPRIGITTGDPVGIGPEEVRAFVDRVVSPSHVDDVAAATRALLRAAPARGLYHCVGSGHATWRRTGTG